MAHRDDLHRFFNELLDAPRFADYGPNGLQVEGDENIQTMAFAVSATAESVARAVSERGSERTGGASWPVLEISRPADTDRGIARRIYPLIRNNLSLFAYHLPLDAHPEVGNAVSLGRLIGLSQFEPFGDYQGMPTGTKGTLEQPLTAAALRESLMTALDHQVLLASPDGNELINTIGIITGGANGDWARAAHEGLDAYITGEMSEHDWHEAKEAGIHMFAGGHHATEVFGIQSLMEKVQRQFDVSCFYIDSDNPA